MFLDQRKSGVSRHSRFTEDLTNIKSISVLHLEEITRTVSVGIEITITFDNHIEVMSAIMEGRKKEKEKRSESRRRKKQPAKKEEQLNLFESRTDASIFFNEEGRADGLGC
ncbi:hypothetical protein CEXT_540051 [Caerostris extrusa]|uniref:Uncharacterized protein n=1 Tax=Caerostris extrusa TaxID=172846 RepID=A0AAV4T8E5_CAEEX|nr:hypothetical protein CEXT_540051 [Caerostris extrusa]